MSGDGFFELIKSLDQSQNVRSFPQVASDQSDWSSASDGLDQPIDCSQLSEHVFPGDRVAIAVHADVPDQNRLLEVLVARLLSYGLNENEILVIQDPSEESFLSTAKENGWEVYCKSHHRDSEDPDESCAMVGVSADGQPIYVNRHVADADVVIPVLPFCNDSNGRVRPEYLYPGYSNATTYDRVSQDLETHLPEIRQAESLVSPFFVLAAGTDSKTGVPKLLFGTRQAVEDAAGEIVGNPWHIKGQQQCGVVFACLQQVEENEGFPRAVEALRNAERLSENSCPIVLVMKNRLGEDDSAEHLESETEEEFQGGSSKSRFIQLIDELTESRPVYLFGQMTEEETEDLGMGFIESMDQVNRLVDRFQPAICLKEAYRWHVTD